MQNRLNAASAAARLAAMPAPTAGAGPRIRSDPNGWVKEGRRVVNRYTVPIVSFFSAKRKGTLQGFIFFCFPATEGKDFLSRVSFCFSATKGKDKLV